MANARFLACCTVFFLSCAAPRLAVEGPVASGPEASYQSKDSPSVPAPREVVRPQIDVPAPPGWLLWMVLDGDLNGQRFLHPATGAKFSVDIEPALGMTSDQLAEEEIRYLGGQDREVYGLEKVIDGSRFTTAQWRGTRGADRAAHGKLVVRPLTTRPDSFLVINVRWPYGTPQAVLDQIDRMILSATIK